MVDGDTIVVNDVRIRLEGIDAPESAQTCAGTWLRSWACGQDAGAHLARLVRDREVACVSRGADGYQRMLGICTVAGLEINADLVRNGLAWAFVKYSSRYVEIEAEARSRRIGIWQAPTMPAWTWRAERWAGAAQEAIAPGLEQGRERGCVIKGNITRNGQVYHMPWSPWYERTRVDMARGERWFCSETEALAAGWRPASPH